MELEVGRECVDVLMCCGVGVLMCWGVEVLGCWGVESLRYEAFVDSSVGA